MTIGDLTHRTDGLVHLPAPVMFFAAYDPHAQWWDELRPYGVRDRDFFGPGTTIEGGAA